MSHVWIERKDELQRDKTNMPDFIYNRIDLFSQNYEILNIHDDEITYCVEVDYNERKATLGMWLNPISQAAFNGVIEYIFNNHMHISIIQYEYGYVAKGHTVPKNHFKIDLPETVDELIERLSSKGRYNIKREKLLLEKYFGSYSVEEYTKNNFPSEIIEDYFNMKKKTHNTDYHMTPNEYMEHYHVTDIYVLKISDRVASIILSCEQCGVVYIENLTYDVEYAKYSVGQILYDIYLGRLIEKGKTKIFLAGGNLDYKRRYGSVEEQTYNCIIFKSKFEESVYAFKEKLRRNVKPKLLSFVVKRKK